MGGYGALAPAGGSPRQKFTTCRQTTVEPRPVIHADFCGLTRVAQSGFLSRAAGEGDHPEGWWRGRPHAHAFDDYSKTAGAVPPTTHYLSGVIPGLDPGTQKGRRRHTNCRFPEFQLAALDPLGGRVKPGHDGGEVEGSRLRTGG